MRLRSRPVAENARSWRLAGLASDTRGRQAGVGWRRVQCPATDWGTVAGVQNGADRSTPRSGRSAREQEARLRCRHTPNYALPRSRQMGATTRVVHGLTRSRRRRAGAIGLRNLAPTSRRPFVPSEATTRRCADSRPFFDKPTRCGLSDQPGNGHSIPEAAVHGSAKGASPLP
jgi:hypothetical protein